MPERNTFSWNCIITAFTELGFVDEALQSFRSMPEPDQCSWNSMVSGFAQQHGRFEDALEYFVNIHGEDFVLNEYTFGSALSACAGLRAENGFFDCTSVRNVVSWNSLITCYEQNGPASEAVQVFVRMMDCGFKPDELTLASMVSACASLSAVEEGRQIHACVMKCDKYRNDVVLCNALVDMYAKCNRINEARRVSDGMPIRNVVSETSMNGENEEALGLFLLLKRESVWPTHYTFTNLLNACASLVDLQLGRQAHSHILKHGFQFQVGEEPDIFVGNSLIDMYMKCGSIEDGCQMFRNMVERDHVSWNAMIVGHAQNGHGTEALEIFRKMLVSGKIEQKDMITIYCY
ncbi:putative tetratricopeptide-like helical domain-containing protein [Rosa chinensis]|uniref:Putative tetratricopeptide-like helical domain-containing protein n=1 Tax=Rosa chinensis TaxID=74649 RepID=A0A2P6S8H4_ROSCH|nr:putative tetratricopeptide-like helical domain-containing protein [Rosa chinensis]